ncbi:MAG: serine/threonine-protein kinase [Pseudomonadota bacterium]
MQPSEVSTTTRFADRYTLVDRLHLGAASEVWLAEDARAEIAVALKILARGAGERDPARDGFEREFQLARGLNHPHTVRVLSWHDSDRPAYAMQYIDGTDFADLVSRSFEVWAPVLLVMTDTLVYWHRKGVVHGDVKPSNLLLDRRGVAYLADFGSAATVHGDSDAGRGGSAAYASPEQQAGQSPDPADDVFAMARVIAELATGDPATALIENLPLPVLRWVGNARGARGERPSMADLCEALKASGVTRGQVDLKALDVTLRRPAASVAGSVGSEAAETGGALPHGAFERPASVQEPTGGIRPRTVALGLAAIVLFGVLFTQGLRWLGPDTSAPDTDTETVADTADAPAAGETEGDAPAIDGEREADAEAAEEEAPVDEEDRVAQRRQADESVARLLSLVDVLERRGVEIWGGAEYVRGRERYAEGDRAYLAGDYTLANERYDDAIAALEPLTEQIEVEFEAAMRDGDAALLAEDSAAARRAFERALAITPGNSLAERGLERANNLDAVLAEVAAGRVAERAGDPRTALARYEAALDLDADWEPAQEGRTRMQAAISASEFQQRMSQGFAALDEARFSAAREAFNAAARIDPSDPAPGDALLQVRLAERLERIDGLSRTAEQQEGDEDWATALDTWNDVLEIDESLDVARQGVARVRNRMSLNRAADAVIDDPDRLSELPALRSASNLLGRLQTLEPRGPELNERIDTLQNILREAAVPVAVTLRSDGATTVTLLRVAQLGEFEQTEVRLRPGKYVLVGSRRGYVDARREFRIAAGEPPPSVYIACEQQI